jgi:sulfur relay (sulfurtransferase) complex TusBCD TusD component (DsrE family)
MIMKLLKQIVLALALIAGALTSPATAGPNDPLFISMLTDDGHRAGMAITFGKHQLERGHPLTIFFNDKGVLVVSKANAEKYAEQQKLLTELIGKGATVLVCGMCMRHYGVKDADLLAGATVGKPELTGGALFKDNTKTLTW